MLEHEPWAGRKYPNGLDGQKIAIVGYSHHHEPRHRDREDLTIRMVDHVLKGNKWPNSFFPPMARYFAMDNSVLWSKVLFFNFLPNCVGATRQRYGRGTDHQIAIGRNRFLRILRAKRPHKVLVFTRKWCAFPETDEERAGKDLFPLVGFPNFEWGTYTVGNHAVATFFLRHPQGASGHTMRRAVKLILARSV